MPFTELAEMLREKLNNRDSQK